MRELINILVINMENKWIFKDMIKEYIKNILKRIISIKKIKMISDSNIMIDIRNNRKWNIQKWNQMNDWQSVIYKFNKTELINTIIMDKLIKELIEIQLNMEFNRNKNRSIIIGDIRINHSLNKVVIEFYYNLGLKNLRSNGKYYISSVNKVLNNLSNNNIIYNIPDILSKYYNKEVIIKPKYIKYSYLNSDILGKTIINNINIKRTTLKGKYANLLYNVLPSLNSNIISNNYENNYKKYLNILNDNSLNILNNDISLNNNNSIINIKSIYKDMILNNNLNDYLRSLLLYKYLTGWSISLKGRLSKSGVDRTKTQILTKGTFNNNIIKNNNVLVNNYKLNYINNSINKSKFNYNSRYGTLGIKIKLNNI